MAWYDFLIVGAERFRRFTANTLQGAVDAAATAVEVLSPDVTKPERKRSREVRKEKRQVAKVQAKQRRKARPSRKERKAAPTPSPRPTPGVSPSRGKEGGGWVLVAGNADIVSLENERGSYPTRSLGMAAYLNALEAIGSEQMVALVHWRSGQLPYVLYVGYVEMSE